jgi:glycerol-3-phosphate dehydrogenase
LNYLVTHEWVVTLDDAIWRRTKLGMWLDETQKQRITDWLTQHARTSRTLSLAS